MTPQVVINGRFLTQDLTGVQRFAREITTRLAAMRHDVVVVAPLGQLKIEPEYDVQRVGTRTGQSWEQVDLPRYLRRHGSPLLLGLGSTGPAFYRNQIVTHHDITYVRHPESFSPGFRLAYRILMPPTLRSARKIITVSEFSKREIVEWYRVDPSKVLVVNNAVGQQFTPSEDIERQRYVLAVSSPNRHKNFDRLVQAAAVVGVPLKIVGDQTRAFAGTVASPTQSVEWLGRVSDAELIDLFRRASMFAFPSLYEGFGIPPLEAQACACPVVAADIAPLRETLQDSAAFFDPHDVVGMAQSIRDVLEDPAQSSRLRDLGAKNVARFSWDRSGDSVSRIVDHCLSERRRG